MVFAQYAQLTKDGTNYQSVACIVEVGDGTAATPTVLNYKGT